MGARSVDDRSVEPQLLGIAPNGAIGRYERSSWHY